MIDYTYDEEANAYYFSADGKGDVCRTSTLPTGCPVYIDWDHYGNVIGVEVLAPTKASIK